MIGAVGHDDGVVRADREASRPGKASGFAPPHPKLKQLPPLQQVMTPPTIAEIDRRVRSIKLITRIPDLPAIVNHFERGGNSYASRSRGQSRAITLERLRDKCSNSSSKTPIEGSLIVLEKSFTPSERAEEEETNSDIVLSLCIFISRRRVS